MSMNDMTEAESKKLDAEIANLNALSAKLAAETFKLNAEGSKINTENRWYLMIVGAAFFAGAAAFTKLFL
ncbi:hypothetical protein [uncultured Ruegeria sp.]|uniref:hypothetical protein n=1 Tax=uncultured Ruegeria sp. TaxID=259304 RepID=UPI00262D996A|nr:hypothetical protein [uncultured Ruegeria sp.]